MPQGDGAAAGIHFGHVERELLRAVDALVLRLLAELVK